MQEGSIKSQKQLIKLLL